MGTSDKGRMVRDMFGSIAGRYDFLNHFLSANIDRRWREKCVNEIAKRVSTPAPEILDIGCGTADLSIAISRLGSVVGCDFCRPMLQVGAQKIIKSGKSNAISLVGADALHLPFPDAAFDIVVSAFVLRNLVDIDKGLREMRRVLRPTGVMGLLDFGMPSAPVFGSIYKFYFLRILPNIGKLLSGVTGPYGYLPDSVQAFPPIGKLKARVEQAGFDCVDGRQLTGGIAVLLTANAKS